MSKYIIRVPEDKEISKCIKVFYTAFSRILPDDITEEMKIWKSLIEWKIGKFLISEDNGKIFGIGAVFFFGKVSSIGHMSVLPEYRGKGVGTEIFKNLLRIADEMGCETKILYASNLGEPIYKKFGFLRSFYGTMYNLPTYSFEFDNINKEVRISDIIPEWLVSLDKQAVGFNRSKYLNLKVRLGAKVISIENEGYGLLVNRRLGPLIAKNLETAIEITKRGITLGANHVIISEHQNLPKKFFKSVNLTKLENQINVRMICGKEIHEKLNLLYAIGNWSKG
ncbi:MAG: GNAT family N-acetyltransferase [Promethearchaeota archaeon]